jgi:hypothetical protein
LRKPCLAVIRPPDFAYYEMHLKTRILLAIPFWRLVLGKVRFAVAGP